MSKQRKIHLFNCDRTYKLDAVVEWLNTAKSKLGLELTTEKHDFSLSQMTEFSSKIIPELDMHVAVFVVHAHESRLSINEENAGIGYAKIYRALLHATKDNVIIVIGGDDSYKNEDEEEKEFISRWARRKISSQFSEEFLDGRKSFIFSWDKKHREIHEEALLHFFDKTKKGQKFEYQPKRKHTFGFEEKPNTTFPSTTYTEYQPKRKLPPPPAMSLSSKAGETTGRLNPEVSKSQQRRSESGKQGWDTLRLEAKPKIKDPYPIASAGHRRNENAAHYTAKADNVQRPGGSDPLQCDTFGFEEKPNATFPSTTYRENATLSTERAGRFSEKTPSQLKIKREKDLSVVGWDAKRESLSAVSELIEKYSDILNLSTYPDVLNLAVNDMISYLENNPLKYCVLVVDAEKVKAARDQEQGVNYLRLLQTAEINVAKKIIIIVCCPRSLSENDEWIVNRTIAEAFNDNSKVYVTWFVNGKLALEPYDFVMLLTSTITKPCSQQQTFAAQTPSFENIQLDYGQENAASGSLSDVGYNPHGIELKNCKIYLPTGNTVKVLTRLCNGNISRRPKDVEYWMPGFVVPVEIINDLFSKNSKKSNVSLAILLNEKGVYTCQVDKKREKEWHQWLLLALDETVVLQTRLKNGQISFEAGDVVIHDTNWQVPQDEVFRLKQTYKGTRNAALFVVSNKIGNARSIVQLGSKREVFAFINKTV